MVSCPSGDTTQSAKACARSFLTCGCLAGFTTITPYWLNRRLSPCTRMPRLPRFLKLSHMRAALVAARDERRLRVGQLLQCDDDVAALDACRIARATNENEVVVH